MHVHFLQSFGHLELLYIVSDINFVKITISY
jgi:hypothetical protein